MSSCKARRITLLSATLRAGGAERAALTLAEAFGRRGYEVTLLTWNADTADFYEVPENVVRSDVGLRTGEMFVRWFDVTGNLRRLSALRRAIDATRPDTVVSFQDGTNELFLLAAVGRRYTKLVSCQNDISSKGHFNSRWELTRSLVYRLADRVVFLDDGQARAAAARYRRWRCAGIPNPLPAIDTRPCSHEEHIIHGMSGFAPRISAMGRLAEQKGFDMLLEAFSRVRKQHARAGLVILGEGPLRPDLEKQRAALGLDDAVLMPGAVSRPHAVIGATDLFAFSSRFEGQGLALAEAMACRVAPVSFDCPSGPAAMISQGVNGVLVPACNIEAFAAALNELVEDVPRRERIASEAGRIREVLDPDVICRYWERLFDEPGRTAIGVLPH